jgi:ABC-type nitrate/sulfonate/bicarbonate transport system substrate-binding protein
MGKTRQVILTRCPIGNATEIALQNGWLHELYKNTDAEFELLQNLPQQEQIKHFTQQAPLAFREGGNIPPIWAKSLGYETIVLGLTLISQSHAILVAPDSDITNPKQLIGKRLSLPKHETERVDFWQAMVLTGYETVLSHYQIPFDKVNFVTIPVGAKIHTKSNADNLLNLNFEKPVDTVLQHQEELLELQAGNIDAFLPMALWLLN